MTRRQSQPERGTGVSHSRNTRSASLGSMSASTGPAAPSLRDLREYPEGTVYVVHLDPPYRHARRYSGNPGSSAFLKVACGVHGRGLAELTGSAWVVGRSASGEGWQQVRVSQRWAVAGSGRGEAGAVQF